MMVINTALLRSQACTLPWVLHLSPSFYADFRQGDTFATNGYHISCVRASSSENRAVVTCCGGNCSSSSSEISSASTSAPPTRTASARLSYGLATLARVLYMTKSYLRAGQLDDIFVFHLVVPQIPGDTHNHSALDR